MKKIISIISVFIFALILSNEAVAQKFKDLDKSPMDIASYPDNWRNSDKVIRIIYSRPQLKGRTIQTLAPAGKKWRTGANETTEITFYKDVVFGGAEVKEGTYSLYTIPGEEEWTVALSNQINVWGAYFHKDENDVVRITAPVSKTEEEVEAFSIIIDENMTIYMGWGNTIVTIPVSTK